MPLEQIQIKGFKSIRELDLRLSSLNVLIGVNGAGKSNFITVFKLLNQIVESNLQSFIRKSGGAEALLYFGEKVTDKIRIYISFGVNAYEVALAAVPIDTLYFEEEVCYYKGSGHKTPYRHSIGSYGLETELVNSTKLGRSSIPYYVLDHLKSWKLYHFHDTSDTALLKKPSDISDNSILKPDASNLAAFLYLLQKNQFSYYKRIVNTIRNIVPFFDDFILRPMPVSPNKIQLEWREKDYPEKYFNAYSMSDGTLRFICLATLLLQPDLPSTILIDEPELGLHPYAITLLADMLASAATRTQVIISTQSVPLVNQFSPEDIIVVEREDEQSVFKRLEPDKIENWLEGYGLGDLWEKNVIGGRP